MSPILIKINTMNKTEFIDYKKHYNFPELLTTIKYNGKIIVISPNTANWIVLDNEEQLDFFEELKNDTLEATLKNSQLNEEDIRNVIIQIEAKKFEDCKVNKYDRKTLHFYLTNGCNMRCPHCYMYAGKKEDNELTEEEIFKVLELFKNFGGSLVTFSGGEVTTRLDFSFIVKYAHKLGLKINILTNGTLWTDRMIKELSPLISRIQISIDGFSEDENAKIRGKGNFKKAINTIDQFVKLKTQTEIAITPLFDENLDEKVQEYVKFGENLRSKFGEEYFTINFNGEILDGRNIHLSEKQRDEYIKIIEKINDGLFEIKTRDIPFILSRRNQEIKDNCAFGNITISSTGDVFFCSLIPSLKSVANIRTCDFSKIMDLSAKAKQLSNVNNLYPCKNCELKYICGGDCRIHHFENLREGLTYKNIQYYRHCDQYQKNIFYEMMIRTNKRIYR